MFDKSLNHYYTHLVLGPQGSPPLPEFLVPVPLSVSVPVTVPDSVPRVVSGEGIVSHDILLSSIINPPVIAVILIIVVIVVIPPVAIVLLHGLVESDGGHMEIRQDPSQQGES